MNDMDNESIKLGGKRSFFVDDFEKYSWENLFDAKVSGAELVELYSTAVESMEENPNIPTLFRDIFKNAYIPYKDPETLRLFLSQINEFEYSYDSEQLGDAFEHILNTLSSQGDAGQFRTPRHIIDFIVEILDPKKNETILDPASGTSGFLISAYKYIIKTDTEENKDNPLSESERKTIMKNINGYDISPDMVRIGLANMYLHGFDDPNVFEYDALSSEDRWNEYYDVILANPPFMTPKGGIRPHNKFGLNSNRAEVLFVDYILTHLKPKGRAGIIVPEGIVFQTGKAYKELRKKLVESGLEGVISLPAGVFKPYSGVKTSILFINKEKQTESIFFEKINNDGFDLGDKRNPIDKNDIPKVLETITNQKFNPESYIKKSKILENDDISLSFNSYTKTEIKNSDWDFYNLMDVVNVLTPLRKLKKGQYNTTGKYPVVDQSETFIAGYSNSDGYLLELNKEVVVFGDHTRNVKYIDFDFIAGADGIKILEAKENLNSKFLYYFLQHTELENLGYSRHFKLLKKIQVPLPPLEKQQEIVDEIEQYQKVIDGARQVVENYKPAIDIEPDSELIELQKISQVGSSKRIFKKEYVNSGVPFYRTKEIVELEKGENISLELFISDSKYQEIKNKFSVPKLGDILISAVGTIGISWVVNTNEKFYFKDGNLIWLKDIDKNYIPEFIKYAFDSLFKTQKNKLIHGAAYNALTIQSLKKFKIPNISIEAQKKLVDKINQEKEIINGNKLLIKINNEKIDNLVNSLYTK